MHVENDSSVHEFVIMLSVLSAKAQIGSVIAGGPKDYRKLLLKNDLITF